MRNILLIASILVLSNSAAEAGTLFRWIDSEGKVHYGDKPEQDAAEIVQKKFTTPAVSNEDLLPYESRRARENFPVTLYVADHCGAPCVQARDFLNKRGIPFAEKFLATSEEIEAFKKQSGRDAIPTIAIGKRYLQGFEAGQWGSELDIAGYPATAPYGVQPQPPVPRPTPPASSVAPAGTAQ